MPGLLGGDVRDPITVTLARLPPGVPSGWRSPWFPARPASGPTTRSTNGSLRSPSCLNSSGLWASRRVKAASTLTFALEGRALPGAHLFRREHQLDARLAGQAAQGRGRGWARDIELDGRSGQDGTSRGRGRRHGRAGLAAAWPIGVMTCFSPCVDGRQRGLFPHDGSGEFPMRLQLAATTVRSLGGGAALASGHVRNACLPVSYLPSTLI